MVSSKKKLDKQIELLAEVIEDVTEEVVQEVEYSTHRQQIEASKPSPERVSGLETALISAFEKHISYEQVPFICFDDLSGAELAHAFVTFPIIVKAVTSCVNVAQRSVERDLNFSFDTYAKRVDRDVALMLAGYLKPLLPPRIAIPALMELDRYWWTDKEMRASKGRWEEAVRDGINDFSGLAFKKRKFTVSDEEFEIDIAYPPKGEIIEYAVDVKRIESPRDIHKRADEIINKAAKFKAAHPQGRFYAVVYYPFPNQHINVQSRLQNDKIDGLFFAAQSPSSISASVELLVGKMGIKKKT